MNWNALGSIVLIGASGVVLALALPGPGWWPLVLLFPPLFLEGLRSSSRWWRAGLLGWFGGILHWMVSCHWVTDVLAGYGGFPVAGAWGGLLVMGIFLGSTWAPVAALTVIVSLRRRVAVFPALWILAEVARRYPPFLFPWNTTASALSGRPEFLGSLPTWGATGLGWALVCCGTGLWAVARPSTRCVGMAVLGTSGLCLMGATVIAPGFEPAGETVSVALIQPGTTLEERWDPGSWPLTAERVWELSEAAASSRVDLVLWPESAMPFRLGSDEAYRAQVAGFTSRSGAAVILNSIADDGAGGLTNSAFAVRPDGAVDRYDKVRLVPFGEYVPGWGRLFVSDSLVREVGAFTAGKEAAPVDAGLPVGVAVCYEIVFPNVIGREIREGAAVIATLTNDAWYGTSWALDQHFAQAILRAVEGRRWVVRAALTGISGAIDPSGRVVERLDAGRQGLLIAGIVPGCRLTPSVRWGDWWVWICGIAVIAVLFRRR